MPLVRYPAGSLCADLVHALPVQHAAISTMGDPFEVETICASDAVAAELDETQLDLGVGPAWRARATGAPVLSPDFRRTSNDEWPMLSSAARVHRIRSVYAFPMTVGLVDVGVVDLYATDVDAMDDADVAKAALMAGSAALGILQRALDEVDAEPAACTPSPRRFVHQATGMVIAQLRVAPEEALLIIRGHAFATGTSVREVAEAIIAREIDFSI